MPVTYRMYIYIPVLWWSLNYVATCVKFGMVMGQARPPWKIQALGLCGKIINNIMNLKRNICKGVEWIFPILWISGRLLWTESHKWWNNSSAALARVFHRVVSWMKEVLTLLVVVAGVLMGIAIRTGSPLSLNLAEPVWKQLAGMALTPADLTEVDRDYVPGMLYDVYQHQKYS